MYGNDALQHLNEPRFFGSSSFRPDRADPAFKWSDLVVAKISDLFNENGITPFKDL